MPLRRCIRPGFYKPQFTVFDNCHFVCLFLWFLIHVYFTSLRRIILQVLETNINQLTEMYDSIFKPF